VGDAEVIRHSALPTLLLITGIGLGFMGPIVGFAAWWGLIRYGFSNIDVVALISTGAVVTAVLVRLLFSVATNFGIVVGDDRVEVLERRFLGGPRKSRSVAWTEFGEVRLTSKLLGEIRFNTSGTPLFLSPNQARVLLGDPRWPRSVRVPPEVSTFVRVHSAAQS